MIVIFLDFDGVLHPLDQQAESLFQSLPLFESVLLQYSHNDLKVVVSSSWGRVHSMDEVKAFFSPEVQPYIVDITPQFVQKEHLPDDLWSFVRHGECWMWMQQNAPGTNWIAIDDNQNYFVPDCPHLFLTDPNVGLTKDNAADLKRRIDEEI